MSIRTLIVDDEEMGRRTLRQLLTEYTPSLHVVAEVATTCEARRAILEHAPDIMFLDIEMPNESGLDFLHSIHKSHRPFAVIIVTGFEKYALPAFREHVFDYLLKPIDVDELQETVARIPMNLLEQNGKHNNNTTDDTIASVSYRQLPLSLLNKKGTIELVDIHSIIYCRPEGNYCRFYLANDRNLIASKPLSKYEDILIDHGCIRIHKSCIVNPLYIYQYVCDSNNHTGGFILLTDGTQLTVARRKREQILAFIDRLCTFKIIIIAAMNIIYHLS